MSVPVSSGQPPIGARIRPTPAPRSTPCSGAQQPLLPDGQRAPKKLNQKDFAIPYEVDPTNQAERRKKIRLPTRMVRKETPCVNDAIFFIGSGVLGGFGLAGLFAYIGLTFGGPVLAGVMGPMGLIAGGVAGMSLAQPETCGKKSPVQP